MSIWQRIFGPRPDNGDRMVKLPAELVESIAEMEPPDYGEYVREAVRQRLRRDYEERAREFLAKPSPFNVSDYLEQIRRESQ